MIRVGNATLHFHLAPDKYPYYTPWPFMPRLPKIERGLYHIIARGDNRQVIFHSNDHRKVLPLLAVHKEKLLYYLLSYSVMTKYLHPLIKRRADYNWEP